MLSKSLRTALAGALCLSLAGAPVLARQPDAPEPPEANERGWRPDRWEDRPPPRPSSQYWECRGLYGREKERCERRVERDRHDREDDRREKDRKKGVAAGVVGTLVVGAVIAAIAADAKKKKERREYCEREYGNYDERTDSYRASDGRWYRCQ